MAAARALNALPPSVHFAPLLLQFCHDLKTSLLDLSDMCPSVGVCGQCVSVFVRPHLGGHFLAVDQTCDDVFSCKDLFRVL